MSSEEDYIQKLIEASKSGDEKERESANVILAFLGARLTETKISFDDFVGSITDKNVAARVKSSAGNIKKVLEFCKKSPGNVLKRVEHAIMGRIFAAAFAGQLGRSIEYHKKGTIS